MSYHDEFLALVEDYGRLKCQEGRLLARFEHLMTVFGAVAPTAPPTTSPRRMPARTRSAEPRFNKGSRRARIYALLQARGRLQAKEVQQAIEPDTSLKIITSTLWQLAAAGFLVRVAPNTFMPVNRNGADQPGA
jgi:hypothetical protein